MLTTLFLKTALKYTNDRYKADRMWLEIEKHYSGNNRHYHNLSHLENMIKELEEVKNNIRDWDAMVFALFYHDVIYKPTAKNNEEESAALAEKRLMEIGVPEAQVQQCSILILATKSHVLHQQDDVNHFTDADLAILGFDAEKYAAYAMQVRKEYSFYPDFLYNPGRAKVLRNFLAMNAIFKTVHFSSKFEENARANIAAELSLYDRN